MKALTTPAVISGCRSRKDRSLGFTVSTPELTAQEKAMFMELEGVNVKLLIEPTEERVPEYKIESDIKQKSPSARMYAVLYILYTQDNEQMTFREYYEAKMEQLISSLKLQITDQI